jgi:mRNA interferase RelE/StbE
VVEVFLLPPAQKDLDGLEVRIFRQIIKKIRALSDEPRPHGCLKLTAEEGYRIRTGDYRILYRIDDGAKRIFIYRIKHRKDAYLD